jgi:lipoprotein-anchoring transpeptidase ErfK/SrfK
MILSARPATLLAAIAALASLAPAEAAPARAPALTGAAVDAATFAPLPDTPGQSPVPEVVKAEVLLDRAHVSPGVIDGLDGENFRKALGAYQRQMGLPATGRLDQATWDRLTAGAAPPLKTAEVTRAVGDGPFTRSIPRDFEAQSKLRHLGYHDAAEALAERYHMGEALLKALNPGRRFAAGQRITVADVDAEKPTGTVARIVVDKKDHDVEALAADGRLLAYYPASIGSEEKPAPTGDYRITRIAHDPDYTYLPKYHFKGVSAKKPFTIAPGPNNPVGLVWMDLSAEGGYGIHGTPNPDTVGKTQSHGCIRLTNWDALNLAAMAQKDTPVSFGDVPGSTGPVQPGLPAAEPGPQAAQPGAQAAQPDAPVVQSTATDAAGTAPGKTGP